MAFFSDFQYDFKSSQSTVDLLTVVARAFDTTVRIELLELLGLLTGLELLEL